MTCGACSARIERKLNKLDGVAAVVNYATERASVTLNGSVSVDEVVDSVESVGYSAHLTESAHRPSWLPTTALPTTT